MCVFAILLLGLGRIWDNQVDLAELNHFRAGDRTLTQLILYDWHSVEDVHLVVAWQMLHEEEHRFIQRSGNQWVIHWAPGVRVRAAAFRETWTDHDPEMANRKLLPEDRRRRFPPCVGQGVRGG